AGLAEAKTHGIRQGTLRSVERAHRGFSIFRCDQRICQPLPRRQLGRCTISGTLEMKRGVPRLTGGCECLRQKQMHFESVDAKREHLPKRGYARSVLLCIKPYEALANEVACGAELLDLVLRIRDTWRLRALKRSIAVHVPECTQPLEQICRSGLRAPSGSIKSRSLGRKHIRQTCAHGAYARDLRIYDIALFGWVAR